MKRLVALALIVAIAVPPTTLTAADGGVIGAAAKFGTAHLDLLVSAAEIQLSGPRPTDSQVDQAVASMVQGYRKSMLGTKVVGLFDQAHEAVFGLVDTYTAGSSLVATIPLRYVKDRVVGAINSKIEKDAQIDLRNNITKFTGEFDYETLRGTNNPQRVKEVLNRLDIIKPMKDRLGGDEKAKAVLESVYVDALMSTAKVTLDTLDTQGRTIAQVQEDLEGYSTRMSDFIEKSELRLGKLETQMGQMETAITETSNVLEALHDKTDFNTMQLSAIGSVVFSHATASERLSMLNAGYLTDVLKPDEHAKLATYLQSEKKREEIVAQISNTLSTMNQIGSVARALGLGGEEIDTALRFANGTGNAISSIVRGDFLGAIGGIVGIFGAGPDPAEVRHQQLLAYLGQEFDRIDQKLNAIIDGQQKLMEGIVALSTQLAEMQKDIDFRLDRIEFTLANIQDMSRQILLQPLASCETAKREIRDLFGRNPRLGPIKFDGFTNIKAISDNVNYATKIDPCLSFIEDIYTTAFRVDAATVFDPLSVRYARARPAVFPIPVDTKQRTFVNAIDAFVRGQFNPTWTFVRGELSQYGLTIPQVLVANSLPVTTTGAVAAKLDAIAASRQTSGAANLCARGTVLSGPWLELLCGEEPGESVFSLPTTASTTREEAAVRRAEQMLTMPLAEEQVLELSDYARYFAPLYDYVDSSGTPQLFEDLDTFLNQSVIEPKGPRLLRGALQTISVSLAQTNMLYGDLTARMVFDALWDPSAKRMALDAPQLTGRAKQGYDVLRSGNPYLARNVLMFALDKSFQFTGDGRFAYEHALYELMHDRVEPDAQLLTLFANSSSATLKPWNFHVSWRPTGDTAVGDADAEKNCREMAADEKGEKKGCEAVPVANILGVEIPLPSVDEFASRSLTFPAAIKALGAERNRLVAALADYSFLSEAVRDEPNPDAARETLVNVLVGALRRGN